MAFVKVAARDTQQDTANPRALEYDALELQLHDESADVRRWAARDLVDCPSASRMLVGRLHEEGDASVREVILTALTIRGDDIAMTGLVECLRSEHVSLRNEAVEAMKQLPEKMAPIIRELLGDPDPDVRIFAVNILESLRHPEVESWLISVIETDPELNVCATAVDLLGEVGSPAARLPLHRIKERYADVPYIQFAAEVALSRLGGE